MLAKIKAFSTQVTTPDLLIGEDSPIRLLDVQGLGPVKANITTSLRALPRGEALMGIEIPKRNIVIKVGLNPDWEENTISSLRDLLYGYFMTGEGVTLRFTRDDLVEVEIEGHVESFEPNIFSKDPEMQISIICEQPDFVDRETTTINGTTNESPASWDEIEYIGTVRTGFTLELRSVDGEGPYSGPITITNQHLATTQTFEVEASIDEDVVLEMGSIQGSKFIQTRAPFDVITNLLSVVTAESVWPELILGTNNFSISTEDAPNQQWTINYHTRFGAL